VLDFATKPTKEGLRDAGASKQQAPAEPPNNKHFLKIDLSLPVHSSFLVTSFSMPP
jgi:hypothetical protein